jgi:hypothetical protein
MTDVTLAIDPGNNTGVAWGCDGRLVACYLSDPAGALVIPDSLRNCGGVGLGVRYPVKAVVEYPKFYGVRAYGSASKAYGVANSLIRESVTLGRWIERATLIGADVVEVLPRDWKSTLPKRAMLKLIWSRLTREERALVLGLDLPKSLVHNVLDAVGVMLWSCGRLELKGGNQHGVE